MQIIFVKTTKNIIKAAGGLISQNESVDAKRDVICTCKTTSKLLFEQKKIRKCKKKASAEYKNNYMVNLLLNFY